MKVKVIVRYVDRDTHEMCDLDDVREYSKERAEELIKGGYVVYHPLKKEGIRTEDGNSK